MSTSLEALVERARRTTSSMSVQRHASDTAKQDAAKSMGLKTYSLEGSFALVVGEHPDLPDVVIKVVPEFDKYVDFAKWAQDNPRTCFPRIDAVIDLPNACMIVAEKIPNALSYGADKGADALESVGYIDGRLGGYMDYDPDQEAAEETVRDVREMIGAVGGRPDAHRGNFRKREDGSLVFVDPIW